jgi:hypothetical protein
VNRPVYFLSILVAVFLLACSSSTPVVPGSNTVENATLSNTANLACWGVWTGWVDTELKRIDLVPLRGSQFIANVTMFLQPPVGSSANMKIQNLTFDSDTFPGYLLIECDVRLTHPFPGLDRYTGFDVRGVFMHNWDYISAFDSPYLTYAGPTSARLLNADGYTRWMNATEFTTTGILGYTPGAAGSPGFTPSATLNPYKYFCDGLDLDEDVASFFDDPSNLDKRGYFRPGSTNLRHYKLLWPAGVVQFQYAVIASYDSPTVDPPVSIPDDFPITANTPEAFLITVTDNGSTAYYESESSKGGDLHLAVEVYDWGVLGHGGEVSAEIGSITLESPGSLIPSPVTFDPLTTPSEPGTAVSSVYQIDIYNVDPFALADQTVLCHVTSAIHTTYDFGFGSDYPEDAVLASYVIFDAPILPGIAELPTAVAATCDCLWISPGESITFDGTGSTSPNGPIVSWEWDFNGDGTFGDPYSGPQEKPVALFPDPGDFLVNLRVTDSAGKTDTLDPSEQLHVHVGTWSPPTAVSEIVPTIGFINFAGDFKGSGSTGPIDLYEWDFEGDCIWDYQSPTIGDTTHAYTLEGMYNAILRVTGQGCDTSEKPVRMIDPLPILDNGNFWDGDFPPWEHGHWAKPGVIVEEILPDPTFKNIVHFSVAPTTDGNCTWITQKLDYDLTGLDHLYFNFFFYVDFNTLFGDGWLAGDPDFHVRILYDDANGPYPGPPEQPYEIWYGYDTSFDGTWQWDSPQPPPWNMPAYVVYHEQALVPEDAWNEGKTIDLLSLPDHKPAKIREAWIACRGWSWEAFTTLPWFSTE